VKDKAKRATVMQCGRRNIVRLIEIIADEEDLSLRDKDLTE
jgi:hypothetical protein